MTPRLPLSVPSIPLFVLLVALLVALPAAVPRAAQEPRLSPLIDRALADPAGTMVQADGTIAVWVFFADRGLSAGELVRAIQAAERALPERTLERRARMRLPGEPLVDASDLAPAAAYVEAVTATGTQLRRTSRWLNAISVDATPAQIDAIAALPFVRKVDLLAKFRRPEPELTPAERDQAEQLREEALRRKDIGWTLDYGGSLPELEQINVPPVHELGFTGQGVIIGMLDSGFKTTHAALAGIPILATYDFVNDDEIVENEPGDPSGAQNHGTMTLSTVMGFKPGQLVAPAHGASAILAKTEDISQEVPIEEDWWVAGLEWVESLGADIVSSSLGYYDWYEFSDLDGNTAVTTIAADLAVGRGVVVVTSAGNSRWGFGHIIAPADGDSVIAVGAVTLAGDYASFSSPGPTYDGRIKPDVMALGVSNHVVSVNNDHGYTTASGTSFSCPLTSGVAALILSRTPTLNPIQVREALRETADRAHAPDNDYGWGVLDALAAVTYWGATILHDPLGDTEQTAAPIAITAEITNRLPLDPSRMHVYWRTGGGPWQEAALVAQGGDLWQAVLPGQPAGTTLDYYLEVIDSADVVARWPVAGQAAPFSFHIGPDTVPPTLVHTPLRDQALLVWPPLVAAVATDNLGVDRIELSFTLDGGPVQGPFLLSDQGDDQYALPFPLDGATLEPGQEITYTLTAWDQAAAPNSTTSGPHDFALVGLLGTVLVIDDSGRWPGLPAADGDPQKLLPRKQPGERASDAAKGAARSADDAAGWLIAAGYLVDEIAAANVAPGSFDGFDAVVLACGDNTSPVQSATLRQVLRDWVATGGRLVVEGGEIGYDALVTPGYPEFAAEVLRAASWLTDNGGSLLWMPDQQSHPVLNHPHVLPASIPLAYGGYADQDAVEPVPEAAVILQTANRPGAAGVLVYDDTPAPQAGQTVYLAFDLRAIAPETGRQLLENALDWLLAEEPEPNASVSGMVSLAGSAEAAGVTVSLPPDHSMVTGPDGHFHFTGLYPGPQVLTAAKPGYTTVHLPLDLADGEVLTDVQLELWPVVEVSYMTAPGVAIPDNNPQGITSTITVTAGNLELHDISVDIELLHTWVGDLTVRLTSPAGTPVTLHNRSGGFNQDIVGNWPETLTVDGPGALADLLGEQIDGDWVLFVSDTAAGDVGTLEMWGLNFLVPAVVTGLGDDLPRTTRLVGNMPNPFNPQTVIAFDLARAGPVKLEVFDARGRLVRGLLDQVLAAGRHQAIWDGRDQEGRAAASGVYLVRLGAEGRGQMHKVMLVR